MINSPQLLGGGEWKILEDCSQMQIENTLYQFDEGVTDQVGMVAYRVRRSRSIEGLVGYDQWKSPCTPTWKYFYNGKYFGFVYLARSRWEGESMKVLVMFEYEWIKEIIRSKGRRVFDLQLASFNRTVQKLYHDKQANKVVLGVL